MPTGICVECGNEKDKIHFGTNEWKRKATRVCTDCVGARAKPTDGQPPSQQPDPAQQLAPSTQASQATPASGDL